MKELDRKSEMVYFWVRAYIEENKFSSNTKIPSETVLTRKLSPGLEPADGGGASSPGEGKRNLHQ